MIEIQGLDAIPREIANGRWGEEFAKYLPGCIFGDTILN